MNQPDKYTTITSAATGDYRDRGSKFLAYAYPVATVEEVKQKIQLLKKEHPKAAHHCYAYRLGTNGARFRSVDDGEPAGSAGKPILGQIDSMELSNILVVVVRYFGGTLLGVSGLINAYKTSASQALAAAPKTQKWIESVFEINFDYPAMGEILYLLKQSEASIYRQDLQLFCTIVAGIPAKHSEMYVQQLAEIRGVTVRSSDNAL